MAGFAAPDLDVMLDEVIRPGRSRARWVWPIAAAVLLLTVPLITLLLRSNSHPAHPATRPTPASKLLGSVPWTGVAVSQGHDGRSVSVWVDTQRTPDWCRDAGLPVLQASTVEKPDKITIQVRAYGPPGYQPPTFPPGTLLGCPAVRLLPIPLLVQLSAPIGQRSLVDATTGQSHPVGQAADLPSLTGLPAGYVDEGATPELGRADKETVDQFGVLQFAARRTYRNGNDGLTLERYQNKPTVPAEYVQLNATGTVLGHPAQVVGGRGSTPGLGSTRAGCVEWSGDGYDWQLCPQDFEDYLTNRSFTAAELLDLANSLR